MLESSNESNTIDIQYVPQSQIQDILMVLKKQNVIPLLLLVHNQHFDSSSEFKPSFIHLQSGLAGIAHNNCQSYYELWTAKGVWQQGKQVLKGDTGNFISFCSNDEYLIGSLSIQLPLTSSLQEISQYYYEQILDFIALQGKKHLLRMWNYFPDINVKNNNLERYQQFCVGRYNAFSQKLKKTLQYPAASAVGSYSSCSSCSSKMVVVFIATKKACIFLENPDQISAYHYPEDYSPKSPSFARAAVYQNLNSSQLYISGTASIVGHQSCFHNDIIGQTQQTIKNLKRLIEHANSQRETQRFFRLSDSIAIKVYLRNPADIAIVSPLIQDFLPDCSNICYLHADICRQELDIEIEMLVNHRN